VRGGEESVGRGREGESVCCLLVLDSVTSTPQWIRQPRPRGCVSSRVFSIPTLACVLMHNEMHARAEMAVEETSFPHQNQEQAANQLE
jgi:hypothetical protein